MRDPYYTKGILMKAFTPRNVAKFVVTCAIHGKVAQLSEDAITNYTQFEEDDKLIEFSGHLIGWFVSDRLKPHTDRMVDKTADWIVARKEKKNQKNTTE